MSTGVLDTSTGALFTVDASSADLVIDELVKRDVFFYNGHAGPYYGFYVDANKEASVGYLELASAPFTTKQLKALVTPDIFEVIDWPPMVVATSKVRKRLRPA